MDFDLFLTSPRWEILQIIAEKPSSPVEIADKLKTTVSYVSQQLKLLDAANLLSKEKTGAVEKGKPRTLFSLSKELLYITILTKNFSQKKLINLDEHHKHIIKIWMSCEPIFHYYLEKLYWKIEEDLKNIDGIFLDISGPVPKYIIVSEDKKLKAKLESIISTLQIKIECLFVLNSQLKKFSLDKLIPLYDPKNIYNSLKGGDKNERDG